MKQQNDHANRYSEEVLKLLPAPVSGIQVQKKNKSRFSIFIEDEFLIGISNAVLTKFKIYKGVEITPFLLDQILDAEEKWAAREYMFRILSRRDHSRKELKTKTCKKGFTGDFIDEILDDLEEKEYINDTDFALKYASDKFKFNDWGPFKIKAELVKKGVSNKVAEEVIGKIFEDDDIKASFKNLILKKKKRFQRVPTENRRKKVFDFLMRKGYDSSSILKHMDELLEIIKT